MHQLPSGLLLPDAPEFYIPAKRRHFRVAPNVHHLPAELLKAGLQGYLHELVGRNFYACAIMPDGDGALIPANRQVREYEPDKREYLMMLVEKANREHRGYGGAWIGAFLDGPHMSLLWKDQDGDVVTTVEDEQPWARMKGVPIDHHIEACENAIVRYFQVLREHGITLDQQIKRAQGQTSADQN